MKTIKGNHDYNRGIRGYSAIVGDCKVCKRPCNTFWQDSFNVLKPTFTCCQDCADKYAKSVTR